MATNGSCCACGYAGDDETPCPKREDKKHCVHWYEGNACACRKAAPGMWTSGYDANCRSFVRHGEKECEEFVRRLCPSGAHFAGNCACTGA